MTITLPRVQIPCSFSAVKYMVLLAIGGLSSLSFTYTSMWWLKILCLAGLFAAVRHASPKQTAWGATAYAMGWFLCGVWWIFISLHTYGSLNPIMAGMSLFALSLFLTSFYVIAFILTRKIATDSNWKNALILAAFLLLAELLRGYLFTGFPWLAIGYSQIDGPLGRWAPWIGVYGIGFLTTLIAALAAICIQKPWEIRYCAPAIASTFLIVVPFLLPTEFSKSNGNTTVSLLQPQVDQGNKFTHELLNNHINWILSQLNQAKGEMVITPETAVPILLKNVPQDVWSSFQSTFIHRHRAALVGIPVDMPQETYTNSFIAYGGGVEQTSTDANTQYAYRYDKHHLVPFGEFTPPGFQWFSVLLNIALPHFISGDSRPKTLHAVGQKWAPMICFEDLFGEELAVRFQNPDEAPTILVNGSNLAWFGRTIAIDQHLHIARMRSLEFQRPTVRSTNTGATAIINHRGVVVSALDPHVKNVLEGNVEGQTGLTPYARWASRYGLWPLSLIAICLIILAASTSFKRPQENR